MISLGSVWFPENASLDDMENKMEKKYKGKYERKYCDIFPIIFLKK